MKLLAFVACSASLCSARDVVKSVEDMMAQHEITGATVAIVSRKKLERIDVAGYADTAKSKPMQKDTIFWIASMTKPITATAVMMLQDEGKLSVEDPASKYIPEFKDLKDEDGKPVVVTLRHMLTHTSGLAEATLEEQRAASKLADLIPAFVSKPVRFAPGSKWEYCQSGINSLSRIVEIMSGMPFDAFLQQRLFNPLGMKDTTFYLSAEQEPRLAKSVRKDGDTLKEVPIEFLQGRSPSSRERFPAGNGGLFSTAPDYARFAEMILNEGKLDGKRYLKGESVRQMTSVQTGALVTGFTPGNGWGLGWCVVRQPQDITAVLSPGSFGHGGAYGTQAWLDPKKDIAIILMVQRSNFKNSDASEVRKAIQNAVLSEEVKTQ